MTVAFELVTHKPTPNAKPAPVPGLYRLGPDTPRKTYLYFVLLDADTALKVDKPDEPPEPEKTLTIEWTWTGLTSVTETPEQDPRGWYVFVDAMVENGPEFAKQVRGLKGVTGQLSKRAVVWIRSVNSWVRLKPSAAAAAVRMLVLNQVNLGSAVDREIIDDGNTVFTLSDSEFGDVNTDNLTVAMLEGRAELIHEGEPHFKFVIDSASIQCSVHHEPVDWIAPLESASYTIRVPLISEQAGALIFRSRWDQKGLQDNWGGTFRFVSESAGELHGREYPLFEPLPADHTKTSTDGWRFDTWLHPLHPTDSECTRLAFDLTTGPQPESRYFRTTTGHPVTVQPADVNAGVIPSNWPYHNNNATDADLALDPSRAGFAVVWSVDAHDIPRLQLSPVGCFAVKPEATESQLHPIQLMCGLSATEFFQIGPRDVLQFATGGDAYDAADGGVLSGDYSTSYVRVWPAELLEPRSGNHGSVTTFHLQSYCAQAEASVYFGPPAQAGDFPLAAGCSLASLKHPAQMEPVPMVPYGGVWDSGNKANGVSAEMLTALERHVLSCKRRELLSKHFYDDGPRFFDLEKVAPLPVGASVRTPMGFLAALNDDPNSAVPQGTVKRLTLGKSPVRDRDGIYQTLRFNAVEESHHGGSGDVAGDTEQPVGVVNAPLMKAFQHPDLFMVVDRPECLPGFDDNEIQLGEFVFQLSVQSPTSSSDEHAGVMIFKFTTRQSFVELVSDPAQWVDSDHFVSNSDITREWLLGLVRYAKDGGKPARPIGQNGNHPGLFADVYHKMTNREWTGLLFLNCPLNYQAMPIDLQDLLGGIPPHDQLRAFHFGITLNQISCQSLTDWDIDNSSIFALVHYDQTWRNGWQDFQLLRLNALFVNSVLAHFDARIGMRIMQLFGDDVKMTKKTAQDIGDNVMVIDGVYQKPGAHTMKKKSDVEGTGTDAEQKKSSHKSSSVGHVVFDTKTPRTFSPTNGTHRRALTSIFVTDAALVPLSEQRGATTVVHSAFAISGQLNFIEDASSEHSAADVFSYSGLGFTGYRFAMTTILTPANAASMKPITLDLSQIRVQIDDSGDTTTTTRSGSVAATMPVRLSGSGIRCQYDPHGTGPTDSESKSTSRSGMGTGGPGAWPVTVAGLSHGVPNFALEFSLPLGSLGSKVAHQDGLAATLLVGWQPANSDDNPGDDDAISVWLLLPPGMTGSNFKLQGVMHTAFTEVELKKLDSPPIYALMLHSAHITLFGLVPMVRKEDERTLTLFGDPSDPTSRSLLWYLNPPSS